MKNLLEKIDVVKIASIGGTVLGIGATLISAWATNKTTDQLIDEKVAKAVEQLSK